MPGMKPRDPAPVCKSLTPGFDCVVALMGRTGNVEINPLFKDWMSFVQGGLCGYCGLEMVRPSMEHIHPRWKGGSYLPPNLMMVCLKCNSRKKDRHHSFVRLSLRIRNSPIAGIISVTQARDLLRAGAVLPIPEDKPLYFETADWPHIKGWETAPVSECPPGGAHHPSWETEDRQ